MTLCERLVTTKLSYVQKSVASTGSQKIYLVTERTKIQLSLKVSVETVAIEMNAPNGELQENALVCGEDSPLISVGS